MWCDLDKPEQIVHLLADADIVDKIFWLYPKKLNEKDYTEKYIEENGIRS